MAAGAVWAFYYIQGEDGEDRSHPNAFRLPLSSSADLTLADVLRHFPLPEPRQFHFRFRVNAKSSFFWLDVTAESHKVPLVNGRVICKLLRLARAPQQGLVFKRKPVLKWSSSSTSTSTSSSAYDRPAKYSDAPAPETPPQSEPRAGSSSSLNGRGSAPSSGPPSRTGSGKRPEAAESFEDFLSGGQSTAPANPSTSVNLMSDDGAWEASDAPRSAASDFLSSMDPLAQQQQQQQQQQRRAQAPPRSTEQPKFDDDGGQTVGPVTMAEMQKYAVSSDGSNVYNPKFIDKSTKSEDVRRAMEERERQMQADVEKAREELRQREQAKNQMNAMKDSANAVLGPKLKAWAEDNGRVKNIRTLLSTMHTVMWDDSKWTEVNMGKLIQTNDIKKQYRKAMIVVHPDKSSGRNAEQLLIAERVFAALNTAWDEFMKTNPC